MATLKQIRQRIRSAKNIRQITRAMKLVAAARLKKAQDRVTEARPYSEKMREFMSAIAAAGSLPDHPLLDQRPVHRQLLVLVTAERGLAGNYNTALIRRALEWLRQQTVPTDLFTVGKKGQQFFAKRGYRIVGAHTLPTAGASLVDAEYVTREVRDRFERGECDAVYVCYSKFFSPIRQVPQIARVLPIEPPSQSRTGSKEFQFEPDAAHLLGHLLPRYVLTLIQQALFDATASEHGARMTAMTSATDNAGKMIDELTLSANRMRQAAITKEILEVVAGADALKA